MSAQPRTSPEWCRIGPAPARSGTTQGFHPHDFTPFLATTPDRHYLPPRRRKAISYHFTNLTIADARKAMRTLTADGYAPRFRGMIWYQGERDCRAANPAPDRYGNLLRVLLNRVRREIAGDETFPWAAFRVKPEKGNPPFFTQIRQGIERVAGNDPAGAWIDVDDLAHPDRIHMNGEGLVVAGYRAAAAIIPLLDREALHEQAV